MPKSNRKVRTCRICRCTDADCSGCIARTGEPCHWVEADLCSACAAGRKFVVAECGYFRIIGGPFEPHRSTRDFVVRARRGDVVLGTIEFYPRWHQHVLVPASGSVWSEDCLDEIAHFLHRLRAERGRA